jgi:hypothetical protein
MIRVIATQTSSKMGINRSLERVDAKADISAAAIARDQ